MNNEDADWFGPDAATFGDRVAGAREATGMTQSQLARRLGVKKVTLNGWEQDMSEPRANKLSMLAGLLNVSMMWLINGEGEGLDAPTEVETIGADMQAVLAQMRVLRAEMHANAETMGRLEKRLRILMETPQHV